MSSEIRVTTPSASPVSPAGGLSIERLRTIIQDSHLNLLVGAGTSAPFLAPLGDVENVLTRVRPVNKESLFARVSVQGYFFEKVVAPNLSLLTPSDESAKTVIKSYARFVAV